MLTLKQAAAILGVSKARAAVLCSTGRIKARKFGNAWMIEDESLDTVWTRKSGRPKKESAEPIIAVKEFS